MRYHFGHVPAPGHRLTPVHVGFARVGLYTVPSALDRAPLLGVAFDQGGTNSCEGHVGSKAISAAMRLAGTPLKFEPSPANLYALARSIDRRPNSDGSPPTLTDSGTESNAVIRAFQEFGVEAMGPRPPDGRYSDVDPATVNDEVSIGDVERDASCKLTGAYSISDVAAEDVANAVARALTTFGPVPVAFWCDSFFQNWTPDQPPVLASVRNDVEGGWHKVLVAGYDRLGPAGTRRWRVLNSWGAGWGDLGYVWVTDAWLASTTEREVYAVRRAG